MAETKLSTRVYRELVTRILDGRLPIGSAVSELALSRELGVSRTPVHLAVRDLMKDGLITQEGNKRPLVARFDHDFVANLFQMRLLLETEATRLAAQRIDRITLQELRQGLKKLDEDIPAEKLYRRWADYDIHFHKTLAWACGNALLCQDIIRYQTVHQVLIRRFIGPEFRQGYNEHQGILDALDWRNSGEAAQRMADHINEWKTFFCQRVAEEQDRRDRL